MEACWLCTLCLTAGTGGERPLSMYTAAETLFPLETLSTLLAGLVLVCVGLEQRRGSWF